MSQTGLIYTIICKVNGKRYVGQTVCELSKRWREHIQESRGQSHKPLYRAMSKYGIGMFNVRILEEDIPVELLSDRERHWITQFDSYNQGYNLTTGGEVSYALREDVRERISESHMGVSKPEEQVQKMIQTHKERKVSFSVRGTGTHHQVKVKAIHTQTGEELLFNSLTELCESLSLPNGNVSRAIKNGYRIGDYKFQRLSDKSVSHPVRGIDKKTGKILHQFDSMRAASRALGSGNTSGISRALANEGKSTWKGCYWYRVNVR